MLTRRVILVILVIGVGVSQGASIPERHHRYPRSRCTSCGPDNPAALAAQWNTPGYDNFPSFLPRSGPYGRLSGSLYPSMVDSMQSLSRPTYPLLRFERSPANPEPENNDLGLFRGGYQDESVGSHFEKHLEELIRRIILATKREQQAENSLYRQNPFSQVQESALGFIRQAEDYTAPDDDLRQVMSVSRFGPKEYPVARDPHMVFGGVTKHWEGLDAQRLGESSEFDEDQKDQIPDADGDQRGPEEVAEPVKEAKQKMEEDEVQENDGGATGAVEPPSDKQAEEETTTDAS